MIYEWLSIKWLLWFFDHLLLKIVRTSPDALPLSLSTSSSLHFCLHLAKYLSHGKQSRIIVSESIHPSWDEVFILHDIKVTCTCFLWKWESMRHFICLCNEKDNQSTTRTTFNLLEERLSKISQDDRSEDVFLRKVDSKVNFPLDRDECILGIGAETRKEGERRSCSTFSRDLTRNASFQVDRYIEFMPSIPWSRLIEFHRFAFHLEHKTGDLDRLPRTSSGSKNTSAQFSLTVVSVARMNVFQSDQKNKEDGVIERRPGDLIDAGELAAGSLMKR